MNVPTPPVSNSPKYQQAADYFTATLDTTQDPCNNFYEYVCGNNNPNIENVGGMDLSQMEDFTDLDAGLLSSASNDVGGFKVLWQYVFRLASSRYSDQAQLYCM